MEQLTTHFEKWVYLFRYMEKLNHIPEPLNEPIFMKLLDKAKVDHLKPYELTEYETTLKTLRDNHNTMVYAIEQGFEEGARKNSIKIARTAFSEGIPIPMIAKLTGLSEEEIVNLLGL